MADPLQSIKQFWFDQEELIKGQLESVIAVVSAERWEKDRKKEMFERQICSANKVLISHVDVQGVEKYETIKKIIEEINCDCEIDRYSLV